MKHDAANAQLKSGLASVKKAMDAEMGKYTSLSDVVTAS